MRTILLASLALILTVGWGQSAEELPALKAQAQKLRNEAKALTDAANKVEAKIKAIEAQGAIDEMSAKLTVVKPKEPRRILIYSRTTGFRHKSIEIGAQALQAVGDKTGTYSSDHTEDPGAFTDENLAKYDGILMLNTTGEPVPKGVAREAMEKFLSQGKGLIGIHAATDCHRSWPNYLEAMGGLFDGHPWRAGDTVTLYNEEPEHPVAKAIPQGYQIKDEIYQYKDEPYFTRDKLRILIALDLAGKNMKRRGMKRKDHDYPVSWMREYQSSRVFYSNLGHNEGTYLNPVSMQHFLDGIQWALGEFEADARPSAAVGRGKPKAPPEGF